MEGMLRIPVGGKGGEVEEEVVAGRDVDEEEEETKAYLLYAVGSEQRSTKKRRNKRAVDTRGSVGEQRLLGLKGFHRAKMKSALTRSVRGQLGKFSGRSALIGSSSEDLERVCRGPVEIKRLRRVRRQRSITTCKVPNDTQ